MRKIIIGVAIWLGTGPLWAAGLSTGFVDEKTGPVPMGMSWDVGGASGEGLVLENLGSADIHVKVEALVPAKAQLRRGAKPIPDTSWIQLNPRELVIPAKGKGVCKITLIIPSERSYKGKLYQVMIWSHGAIGSQAGTQFEGGLLSRLQFIVER